MILTERTLDILTSLAARETKPSSLLLTGPLGAFIRHAALYLAYTLNHEPPSLQPNPNNPYIIEINSEKSITIGQIRDLQTQIRYGSPHPDKTLSVILHDIHKMTTEAANAFLKTLEEPPQNVLFILLTSRPQHCLPTIKSRCQQLPIFKANDALINAFIAKNTSPSDCAPTTSAASSPASSSTPLRTLVELETGQTFDFIHLDLAKILNARPTQRLLIAQELSKHPMETHLTMQEWLRQWKSNYTQHPNYKKNSELLIEKITQLQYNLNLRHHVETLVLNLTS